MKKFDLISGLILATVILVVYAMREFLFTSSLGPSLLFLVNFIRETSAGFVIINTLFSILVINIVFSFIPQFNEVYQGQSQSTVRVVKMLFMVIGFGTGMVAAAIHPTLQIIILFGMMVLVAYLVATDRYYGDIWRLLLAIVLSLGLYLLLTAQDMQLYREIRSIFVAMGSHTWGNVLVGAISPLLAWSCILYACQLFEIPSPPRPHWGWYVFVGVIVGLVGLPALYTAMIIAGAPLLLDFLEEAYP